MIDDNFMAQPPQGHIDLKDLFFILWDAKWGVMVSALIGIVLAATVTSLIPKTYNAVATLEIKGDSGSVIKFENLESVNYKRREYINTQLSILRSDSVLESVISELKLDQNPILSPNKSSPGFLSQAKTHVKKIIGIEDANAYVTSNTNVKHFELLTKIREQLIVTRLPHSDLIHIGFNSIDPQLSTDLANTVVSTYIKLSRSRRLGSASGAKVFLEKEIIKTKGKLEKSEKQLTEFARKNNIIDVNDSTDIILETLKSLSNQLTHTRNARIEAESEFLQSQQHEGFHQLPKVLDNGLVQKLKSEHIDSMTEYLKLSKKFKPDYPVLQQIEAQMGELSKTLDAEVDAIVGGLKAKYEQLMRKEQFLERDFLEKQRTLFELKEKAVQYRILKREWQANEQLYTSLLERKKEVGVAAGLEIDNISLVDPAVPPVEHHAPEMSKNALLGLIGGIFLGIAIAFLRSIGDGTTHGPRQLSRISGIINLGMLPKLTRRSDRKFKNSLATLVDKHKGHPIAREMRRIRSLLTSGRLDPVLHVVGASGQEGKTTFASNLAILFAQMGKKTLLIETSQDENCLSHIFHLDSSTKTSGEPKDQSNSSIQPTAYANLSIATGKFQHHMNKTPSKQAYRQSLHTLSKEYDQIIVDCPPLLHDPEALDITTNASCVLFMVKAGSTLKTDIGSALDLLYQTNANVIGTILNYTDRKKASHS